jgi:hypothetical protein
LESQHCATRVGRGAAPDLTRRSYARTIPFVEALRRPSLRRPIATALAIAVLVASSLAGARFVWCVPMQRAQLHCCCHGRWLTVAHDAVPAVWTHCCDGRRIGSVPPTTTSGPPLPTLAPAPLVAVLALADVFPRLVSTDRVRERTRNDRARDGPRPAIYLVDRAFLN